MKSAARKSSVFVCKNCEEFFSSTTSLRDHQNTTTCKKLKCFSIRHQAVERRIFGGKLKFPRICLKRWTPDTFTIPKSRRKNDWKKQADKNIFQSNGLNTTKCAQPVILLLKQSEMETQNNLKTNAIPRRCRNPVIVKVNPMVHPIPIPIPTEKKHQEEKDDDKPVTVSAIISRDMHRNEASRLYCCKKCNYMSIFEKTLRRHYIKVHGTSSLKRWRIQQPNYVCSSSCSFTTHNTHDFQQHVQDKHPDMEIEVIDYNCEFCDFKAKSMHDVSTHQNCHKQLYPCKICNEKFQSFPLFSAHICNSQSQESVDETLMNGEQSFESEISIENDFSHTNNVANCAQECVKEVESDYIIPNDAIAAIQCADYDNSSNLIIISNDDTVIDENTEVENPIPWNSIVENEEQALPTEAAVAEEHFPAKVIQSKSIDNTVVNNESDIDEKNNLSQDETNVPVLENPTTSEKEVTQKNQKVDSSAEITDSIILTKSHQSKTSLLLSLISTSKVTMFSCNFCDLQYIHSSFLKKHINVIHKSEVTCEVAKHQCKLCLVICDSEAAFNSHMERHD